MSAAVGGPCMRGGAAAGAPLLMLPVWPGLAVFAWSACACAASWQAAGIALAIA